MGVINLLKEDNKTPKTLIWCLKSEWEFLGQSLPENQKKHLIWQSNVQQQSLQKQVNLLPEQEHLKALFNNDKLKQNEWKEVEWEGFTAWVLLKFSTFKGNKNLKAQEYSTIEIPENGLYSLTAFGEWKANKNETSTAELAIGRKKQNSFEFVPHYFTRNTITADGEATHNLNQITRLEKGQKFNFLLKSNRKVEYHLWSFKFEIEKIN